MRKLLSLPLLLISGVLVLMTGLCGLLAYLTLWLADKVEG